MNETSSNEPNEPSMVCIDNARYLELIEHSKGRKAELERLRAVVAESQLKQVRVNAEQLSAITTLTARASAAEARERATWNKLVVTAKALDGLTMAVLLMTPERIHDSHWPTVKEEARKALELIQVLKHNSIL